MPTPEDLRTIQAMANYIARRNMWRVGAAHDLDVEDVVQECIADCLRGWHRYDPARGRPTTFAARICWCTVVTLSRHAAARPAWRAPEEFDAPAPEIDELPEEFSDVPLRDWLAQIYAAAKLYRPPARYRRGRRFYNVAQVIALSYLQRRLKLSIRGMRQVLEQRPDLAAAVKLRRRIPGYHWLQRCVQLGSVFQSEFDTARRLRNAG
jgi:DNA-directed RNA polymerase specialized sigma24 family protein